MKLKYSVKNPYHRSKQSFQFSAQGGKSVGRVVGATEDGARVVPDLGVVIARAPNFEVSPGFPRGLVVVFVAAPVEVLDGDVQLAPLASRAGVPFLAGPSASEPHATVGNGVTSPFDPHVESEGVVPANAGLDAPTEVVPAPVMVMVQVHDITSLGIVDGVVLVRAFPLRLKNVFVLIFAWIWNILEELAILVILLNYNFNPICPEHKK